MLLFGAMQLAVTAAGAATRTLLLQLMVLVVVLVVVEAPATSTRELRNSTSHGEGLVCFLCMEIPAALSCSWDPAQRREWPLLTTHLTTHQLGVYTDGFLIGSCHCAPGQCAGPPEDGTQPPGGPSGGLGDPESPGFGEKERGAEAHGTPSLLSCQVPLPSALSDPLATVSVWLQQETTAAVLASSNLTSNLTSSPYTNLTTRVFHLSNIVRPRAPVGLSATRRSLVLGAARAVEQRLQPPKPALGAAALPGAAATEGDGWRRNLAAASGPPALPRTPSGTSPPAGGPLPRCARALGPRPRLLLQWHMEPLVTRPRRAGGRAGSAPHHGPPPPRASRPRENRGARQARGQIPQRPLGSDRPGGHVFLLDAGSRAHRDLLEQAEGVCVAPRSGPGRGCPEAAEGGGDGDRLPHTGNDAQQGAAGATGGPVPAPLSPRLRPEHVDPRAPAHTRDRLHQPGVTMARPRPALTPPTLTPPAMTPPALTPPALTPPTLTPPTLTPPTLTPPTLTPPTLTPPLGPHLCTLTLHPASPPLPSAWTSLGLDRFLDQTLRLPICPGLA
ncbi:uncharacterized protein LOC144735722 isoform X2 [Lampetra planeri]